MSDAFAGVELRGAKGGVLVNKGAGYQQARGSASLVPSDRLMVSADSQATLVYSDGCKVPVNPGSVVTIGEKSPCVLKAQFDGFGGGAPLIIGGLSAGFLGFIALRGIHDTRSTTSP